MLNPSFTARFIVELRKPPIPGGSPYGSVCYKDNSDNLEVLCIPTKLWITLPLNSTKRFPKIGNENASFELIWISLVFL